MSDKLGRQPAAAATPSLASRLPLAGTIPATTPRLVYGTAWKGDRTAELVYLALKAGFRGVDTAAQPRHYRERLVGDGIRRAISEGIVSREELYVRLPPFFVILLLFRLTFSRTKFESRYFFFQLTQKMSLLLRLPKPAYAAFK
jgi:hypothetical protein